MFQEILGIAVILLLTLAGALLLGPYLGKVYTGERVWTDRFLSPVESIFYRIIGTDPRREMGWKEHLYHFLLVNLLWFGFSMFVLMNMSWLPLNPDGNPSMSADLAFNTSISFISNTNLQHYSGETGVSYLGQLVLTLFQFISAAAGMAVCALVFLSMREDKADRHGSFHVLFIRSLTRVLLPLSIVVAVILLFRGMPMTFEGKDRFISLQGDTVNVSRGPAAAMVAIKQLGTNGGGFFGANSAHPLENPDYFTNIVENVSILLIPIALVFAMGHIVRRRKLAWMIFGVMMAGFLCFLIPAVWLEMKGNPAIAQMGITQHLGSMEGKEVRFGPAASAYWAISTTVTSNGSVNAMHDSLTPITGMLAMLGMMVNSFFGGVGVGFLNFYVFIIIAVFISGLMVGRTPEFLGRKIEAREMKIASIIALLHPFLILTGTAISSYLYAKDPTGYGAWLNNPGHHGFSEMLYEFTSSSANNGSGFEGLGDNTPFWNIACGMVMLVARFLPIIGPVAIAGILAAKKRVPESAGTLRTDTSTFALMVTAVIFIIAALSFFPALALGPLAEFFDFK